MNSRPIPIEGSTGRKTAGRPGKRSCSSATAPARSILSMDPTNPNVIYAVDVAVYTSAVGRVSAAGPTSGLYKTTDGGDHWTNISHNPGMPTGVLGKIGVSISAVAAQPGLRADRSGPRRPVSLGRQRGDLAFDERRPAYTATWPTGIMHVIADPQNPDTVYVLRWPDVQVHRRRAHDPGSRRSSMAIITPCGSIRKTTSA